jgi:hypothetical protein
MAATFIPPVPKSPIASNDAIRAKLYYVAKYQRWVLLALLLNIVVTAILLATLFGAWQIPTGILQGLGVGNLFVCAFMTISAVLLAKQFWNLAVAILAGLMMWVPFLSLVTLLILSQKSTGLLQKYGIKVGLLGARPGQLSKPATVG